MIEVFKSGFGGMVSSAHAVEVRNIVTLRSWEISQPVGIVEVDNTLLNTTFDYQTLICFQIIDLKI